ncbi:hypothetical protein NXX87_13830 [Bacteroides faecis]|uniref:hypothetical protein n=1 Tax=Bacteroides faecis TaxID=674529 RepID=UPI0021640082|nr:hypothetical protein [Bacteroides faecis]UVS37064.1 hypothetical protein NXX87_13830 [Bacteroides faecis]
MYFRCQILINGISYEATDDLKNWDDFELAYKRSDYDGVLRSFSTKFEFVNRSYNLLKEEYSKNYLSSSAGIAFYKRNNSWNWDKVFQCALDFSSYSDDGYTISINAIDDTLAAIIKAKRNIQYEYLVSELKPQSLYYDGLKFQYEAKYVSGGTTVEDDANLQYIQFHGALQAEGGTRPATVSFPVYILDNSELPKRDSPLVFTDEPFTTDGSVQIFAEALSNIDITLKLSFSFYVTADNAHGTAYADVVLFVKRANGDLARFGVWRHIAGNIPTIVSELINISLNSGDSIGMDLLLYNSATPITMTWTTYLRGFSLSVNFQSRINSVNIDVLLLTTVAEKLLESMTDSSDYSVDIYNYVPGGITRSRLSSCFIMPAESARNLPNAKLYTSFKKFCEFMEAEFGYVLVVEGNNVTFIHRYALFDNYVVKDLSDQINDYEYSVNSSLVNTSVKVGYDKQDYDSINGRDEFRFTNEFSTGLKLTDNTLSFISPYRADAYGIEFLVQKRGEDTTDNDSDNDVFIVGCQYATSAENGNLLLDRPYSSSQLLGLISPDTMFNIEYSPRFMLEANKAYIGACTNMLKFTSSDGNSNVSIAGIKETDDFPIDNRLFTVGEVDVETSEVDIPSNLSGLISLDYNGEAVHGYIKEMKINVGKTESVRYSLIVKEIKS